ncbi:MAG TPA: hypothetical protein VI072_12980 [Polyangiaceae bacterium]
MPTPFIAPGARALHLNSLALSALFPLASCSITAPSDGDLMDRPARVDAGTGGDASVADSGHDAGPPDGAGPLRCTPACLAKQFA